MNALQHGMTAFELVFEDDIERLQNKAFDWLPELKAEGPFQLHQLERMAAAAVLIERCREQETDYRYRLAARTEAGRALDRSVEVEGIAEGLPRRPARVARRLQQTVQGNEWLLARLRALRETICGREGKGPLRPLGEDDRCRALDVLGVAPELRQGPTVLDLPAAAATAGEADVAAHQARVIEEQIARLERFKTEDLAEVEAIDGDANTMGRETKVDPEIAKIRRYQKDAQREMDKAQAELQRLQALAEAAQAFARAHPRAAEAPEDVLLLRAARSAVAAALAPAPAAPPTPVPPPPVSPIEPATVLPMTAAVDKGHEDFEAALREAFATPGPHRRRDERSKDRPARAAHKGFPGLAQGVDDVPL